MSSDWSQQLADELHKPITRKFQKRRVISNNIDDIWTADLVEMQNFSKWNKGIRYLLMVIDVFSKYGWIRALKNKKAETVYEAFRDIITGDSPPMTPSYLKNRKPKMLWTDKGTEFTGKYFRNYLGIKKIKPYHTENIEKSSVIERWNRTIKEKIWKIFTVNNDNVYWDKIDKIVDDYNNSIHSSIKMTPVEASNPKNRDKVWYNLYYDLIYINPEKPKFEIGDKVRIPTLKRRVFDKGYTPNWTEEIFIVDEILPTKPITYKIVDLMGKEIKGTFYEKELQKSKQQTFRIEKVIKKDDLNKLVLVKWKGYPDKFNSWVSSKDMVNF